MGLERTTGTAVWATLLLTASAWGQAGGLGGDSGPAPVLSVPRAPGAATSTASGSGRIVRPSDAGLGPATAAGGPAARAPGLSGDGELLLPEGYRLAGREGELSRDGAWWVFKPDESEAGPPIPPLRLLPSRILEHVEAVARRGERAMRFRLSGMITEYRDSNYLALSRAMLAAEPDTEPTSKQEATATQVASTRPGGPAATEILNLLAQDRPATPLPVTAAARESRAADADPPPETGGRRSLPDGTILVDRLGRLVRDARGWMFVFETQGRAPGDAPVRILPSRLLETMETASAGGSRHVIFLVSGEIMSHQRQSFLLLRKVLIRRSLGNLR